MPRRVSDICFHAFLGLNKGEASSLCKLEGGEQACVFSDREILGGNCQDFCKTIMCLWWGDGKVLVPKESLWAYLLDLSGTWYLGRVESL